MYLALFSVLGKQSFPVALAAWPGKTDTEQGKMRMNNQPHMETRAPGGGKMMLGGWERNQMGVVVLNVNERLGQPSLRR